MLYTDRTLLYFFADLQFLKLVTKYWFPRSLSCVRDDMPGQAQASDLLTTTKLRSLLFHHLFLSSVFFNPYHKNQLASSDYEGCVCIWDVSSSTKLVNHQEHSKRVWSVVYNPSEPTMYASGSDDCTGTQQCVI